MKIHLKLILLYALCTKFLFGVDDFVPKPIFALLDVPVSEASDGPVVEEKGYLLYGDYSFKTPKRFSGDYEDCDFANHSEISDFFRFLDCLVIAYQGVQSVEDVMDFTYVEDEEKFFSILDENWERIKKQYKGLREFGLRTCWFSSDSGALIALIKIIPESGKPYTTPMHFVLGEKGWGVKSGFLSKDVVMQDIHRSGNYGSYEEGVVFYGIDSPIPPAVSDLVPEERAFDPIEVPEAIVNRLK